MWPDPTQPSRHITAQARTVMRHSSYSVGSRVRARVEHLLLRRVGPRRNSLARVGLKLFNRQHPVISVLTSARVSKSKQCSASRGGERARTGWRCTGFTTSQSLYLLPGYPVKTGPDSIPSSRFASPLPGTLILITDSDEGTSKTVIVASWPMLLPKCCPSFAGRWRPRSVHFRASRKIPLLRHAPLPAFILQPL